MWSKISWKKCLSLYFIWLYERQNCPEPDLYGSTQVESPICRARSQICTQYMLRVRFFRACHLALVTVEVTSIYLTRYTLKGSLVYYECYVQCWKRVCLRWYNDAMITTISVHLYLTTRTVGNYEMVCSNWTTISLWPEPSGWRYIVSSTSSYWESNRTN